MGTSVTNGGGTFQIILTWLAHKNVDMRLFHHSFL